MKRQAFKVALSAFFASASIYFDIIFVPVVILIVSMVIDYISGIIAAWVKGELNSKKGKIGAIKKVSYMLLVVVAGIIDWLLKSASGMVGINYEINFYFGVLVSVWLIINELLSILENCTLIGIPVPDIIKPVAMRLKILVEQQKGDDL